MALVKPRTLSLSMERRQVLRLVADRRTTTKALLFAQGVSRPMLASLVRAGLVTIHPQVIKAGWKTIDVAKVRITPAGRDALAALNTQTKARKVRKPSVSVETMR
jgi:hypothetical protein